MVFGDGVGGGGSGECGGYVEVELAEEAEEAVETPDCDDGVEVGLELAVEDLGVAVVKVGQGGDLKRRKGRV